MSRKIICYIMSLVILLSVLPITVSAEEIPIIGYIEVFSDIDNTERKIKALNNEETIFVSAEDISLITGYDLEIDEFINYSKAGGLDNVTAVDIEFDGAVSAMGKNFEVHIVNYENGIYLPLLQMLYLLHCQWWISEDKLVVRSLPYTIIDFLGGENYEAMWENKVNQTDLLINGENKLEHAFRTSLAAVFNDFDPKIFVLWWPDEGASPFINEEYEEALLQIAIDDMDFLNTYDQKSMLSIFEEVGFSDVKSNWGNAKNIIDIPDNIAEGAYDIDKIVESLSKDKALKSYFIYDFETFDPALLKAMSEKMETASDLMDITNIILDVAEVSQRSQNWGEQYINQIRILTNFDDRGYNKSVANRVKTVADGLIKEYQDPIQAASDEAALQSTSLLLSKIFDKSVYGIYFAVFNGGLAIAKTYDNVRNDMDAADLAYMVDCLVKVEQIAMKEMSRSYSKLLDVNITGNFTQSDLERLRNCTMLSLRTNLRNRAFLYYLNLRLNDDHNWENSINAKNIQQQIIEDYAKICLLMETEKYDNLLFINDFKDMYSDEYGLIREQFTFDIFHEGEIVDETEDYSDNIDTEQEISSGVNVRVQRINYYLYSDTCTSYAIPEYNGEKEIGGQEYLPDGQKRSYYIYEYDESGNMIKETWLNLDGSTSYWNEYDYDDFKNKVRGRHYSGNGDMNYYFEYRYNEAGQCVLEVRYDPYGSEQLYFENEFDENKRKVSSTLYNSSSGNKTHWIEFEYDLNGNCINEIWHEISGVVMQRIEKLYETNPSSEEFNSESIMPLTEEEAYKKVEEYWKSLGYNMPEEVEYEGLTESGHCFWGYNMIGDRAVTHFWICVDENTGQIIVEGGIYREQ